MSIENVYWLGGGSCAGKTTLGKMFEINNGFTYYNGETQKFFKQGQMDHVPLLKEIRIIRETDKNWRWLFSLQVEEMAQFFLSIAKENIPLILDEVLELAGDSKVIVDTIFGHPSDISREGNLSNAVFLIADSSFQENEWHRRTWPKKKVIANMENPVEALKKWVQMHRMVNESIVADCERCGVDYIVTSGVIDLRESYRQVAKHFGVEPLKKPVIPEDEIFLYS